MTKFCTAIRLGLALAASISLSGCSASDLPSPPVAATLVTEDIERFWAAFDALPAEVDPAADARLFEALYLQPGSRGLKEFVRLRIGSAGNLAKTVRARQQYYAGIRENSLRVAGLTDDIRAKLARFGELYPEARFPPVYFLIGRLNSGGTLTDQELLIGLEMLSADAATPRDELSPWERTVVGDLDSVPCMVLHELMHFQQRMDEPRTLLVQAFAEGSANFLAELAGGCTYNQPAYDWAASREAEVWQAFSAVMHGEDMTGWLYGGDANRDRPADVGYFIGHRIAQAYYAQATDKRQAIVDILLPRNVERLLEQSGYARRFSSAASAPD